MASGYLLPVQNLALLQAPAVRGLKFVKQGVSDLKYSFQFLKNCSFCFKLIIRNLKYTENWKGGKGTKKVGREESF